ncbi:hypothetical protein PHMEG_00035328 [Phytophthora megakarya]|uniref:Uncharacterized protein n=1 Tax=Phytophthora megakarya TaxID=4795 RepID=A0A225UPB7_9STRA|nr:hypothetical protein PHMEG_00035328 [Phytophthora megakarya]
MVVNLILHRNLATCVPDIITTIISDFLITDLTLAQACQWTHIGSTFLLDLVWMRSLRDVKTSKWTLAKLLQSERHYHQWACSQSLIKVIQRGDLVLVQWLLTHFSRCTVSKEVVEKAAQCGNLWVLQLLEGDKRHGGIEWSENSVNEAARIGNWELVKWLLKRTPSTRETRRANDDVVTVPSYKIIWSRLNGQLKLALG